jgi:glycerophosphoryl diester phosphodiesterase
MTAGSDPEDPGDLGPDSHGHDGAREDQESEKSPEADAGHLRLAPVLDLCVSLGAIEAIRAVHGVRVDGRSFDPGPLPLCGLGHRWDSRAIRRAGRRLRSSRGYVFAVHLRAVGRPLCVGHKGAAALEPENTLRSLARAAELGCDLVEFDVLDLSDGTLVLAHSDDLLEVSHGAAPGRVRTMSLAGLREVAPELPTFDEALELLGGLDRIGIQVDLKDSGFEEAVAQALRRHGLVERSIVSTFRVPSLIRLRQADPSLARALTYPADRHGLSRRRWLAPVAETATATLRRTLPRRIQGMLRRVGASAAMLHFSVVSRVAVERAHAFGASVFAWTVDDRLMLERMVAAGVDGVITNDPRIFVCADYTQDR